MRVLINFIRLYTVYWLFYVTADDISVIYMYVTDEITTNL